MFYAVYDTTTGALHAIEQDISKGLPEGMSSVEIEDYADLVWNETTRGFDPRPPRRVISRKDFIDRFTTAEWVQLVALKAADPVIAATFERLSLLDMVELDATFTQGMAAHAVSQGYLSQERMDKVLA